MVINAFCNLFKIRVIFNYKNTHKIIKLKFEYLDSLNKTIFHQTIKEVKFKYLYQYS